MSQLGLILQESLRTERETRTILGLLTDQIDGGDTAHRRRRTLKERLRFTGMGCCGATWVFRPIRQDHQEEAGGGGEGTRTVQQQQQDQEQEEIQQGQDPDPLVPDCVGPGPSGTGMNLAAALAAERQFRGSGESDGETPLRVSLMRLLEETEVETTTTEKGEGNDSVCCVCMGRKKGAAFIPCGHTFCRVCSRELWLNRGNCPLCNRSILEILDIF